jgi:uncharacterized membrane protein YphA (DoxX/SURF4 family)
MSTTPNHSAQSLVWLLRLSMAGTYIGHGAFGIIGKEAWLPYFNIFGFSDSQGWTLMPYVGAMDIALGILILVWPTRASMLHLALWGVMTAMLRPLTGEGTWEEVFERAGNFCIPMALLVLVGGGGRSLAPWFRRVSELPVLDRSKALAMHWILRVGTALLLIGHGGFGVWMHKPAWVGYFDALGIDAGTVASLHLHAAVGWFEIAFGVAVLYKPVRPLLLAACAYKVGTELLRPAAGEPWWEFIERAGSYLAPVALLIVDRWRLSEAPAPASAVVSPVAGLAVAHG